VAAFVHEQVVRVDLADRRGQLAVEIDELVLVAVLPLVRQRFVEEVVAEHGLAVAEATGDLAP
jgi:hypothetical protein